MRNKGFTLIELLVVVLIIGILAAIAVPQYKKAILKSRLHQGISLVSSIYQAQQAYILTHGDFATDINELDLSLPLNESCEKSQSSYSSHYTCDFGKLGQEVRHKAVFFTPNNQDIRYLHFFADDDIPSLNVTFKKDKRYCWAGPEAKTAQDICQDIGGTLIGENPDIWKYYELK